MPEIDPTSPYAHLIQLSLDYKEAIDMAESGLYETDDVRELLSQRSLLHDAIIAEFQRLGISITSRDDAMRKAYRYAQWYRPPEE